MWMWLPWLEMKQLRTVGPFPFRVSASASLVGHVHQIWDSKQLFAVAFPAKLLHWKSYLAGLPPFYGKGMGWMEHFNRTRPNLMLKTMGFQSIFHPFWWDSQAPGLCRGRRHLRHRSLCCAWHPGPTGLVWGDAWQDLPRGVFYRFFFGFSGDFTKQYLKYSGSNTKRGSIWPTKHATKSGHISWDGLQFIGSKHIKPSENGNLASSPKWSGISKVGLTGNSWQRKHGHDICR